MVRRLNWMCALSLLVASLLSAGTIQAAVPIPSPTPMPPAEIYPADAPSHVRASQDGIDLRCVKVDGSPERYTLSVGT